MTTLKVPVIGTHGAGKTTFIRNFPSKTALDADDKSSSNDYGCYEVNEQLCVALFGSPGHQRFDFIWEILAEGMAGFIFLVDGKKPETFQEARDIFEKFKSYTPVPYVIAVNKQDTPGALSPDDIRTLFRLQDDVKLLPCVATDKESCKNVLFALLNSISEKNYLVITPTPPASLTSVASDVQIHVTRAGLSDSQRIAAFFNACKFHGLWDEQRLYQSFREYGYFLALVQGELVGVGRLCVRNLVMEVSLVISPLAPTQNIGTALLDTLHLIARELEVEFSFAAFYRRAEAVFTAKGYRKVPIAEIEVDEWRNAVGLFGGQVICLQLRAERVTKPI